jgi:hypothetical protein
MDSNADSNGCSVRQDAELSGQTLDRRTSPRTLPPP